MQQFLKEGSAVLRYARSRIRALASGKRQSEKAMPVKQPSNDSQSILQPSTVADMGTFQRASMSRHGSHSRRILRNAVNSNQWRAQDVQDVCRQTPMVERDLGSIPAAPDNMPGLHVGQFVHDLDNLLMVIVNRAEMAQADMKFDRQCAKSIRAIQSAAENALELSGLLRTSAGGTSIPKCNFNLVQTIQSTIEGSRAWIPSNVAIVEDLPAHVPAYMFGNATQIVRVIQNLFLNAAESLRSGGHLFVTLETSNRCPARPQSKRATSRSDRFKRKDGATGQRPNDQMPRVILKVRDTGIGMDAHTVARAFEPGFTLKQNATGGGLGLSIVADIVRDHGGVIAFESGMGTGTEVRITFPLVQSSGSSPSDEGFTDHD